MRTQKSKGQKAKRIQQRWHGYYMEDLNCKYCIYWQGKKRGCALSGCTFEEEKRNAIKNGRLKRQQRLLLWDM